jgi:Tol biopolymer transport system component
VPFRPFGTHTTGFAEDPSISDDGRYISYQSTAPTLVEGANHFYNDVFLWDRETGQFTHVSAGLNGAQANNEASEPKISGDARSITYMSFASNMVAGDTNNLPDIFVWDRNG